MYKLFFLFLIPFTILYASSVPNFKELDKTQDAVFFLSTPRSGTNLVSASLSAITRKPISWISWKEKIFKPNTPLKDHPSYNRLGLPLVTEEPLFYRTHDDFLQLNQIPSRCNKLIFITRNPKELLFRKFLTQNSSEKIPDRKFIKEYLDKYLQTFQVYDSWFSANRSLVFYEDFIRRGDEILLELVQFMGEKPTHLLDFQTNKEKYMSMLLASYQEQHKTVLGGLSARRGPTEIYYTKNAPLEVLTYIDDYIKKTAPNIWEKYLTRFQS
jgi:hypothetical protein